MGKLKIRVLGTLLIEDEGNITFSLTRKNKAVLAALALAGPAGLPRQKRLEPAAHNDVSRACGAQRFGRRPLAVVAGMRAVRGRSRPTATVKRLLGRYEGDSRLSSAGSGGDHVYQGAEREEE